MRDYTLIGADGAVSLADVFDGRSQLIVYNHMWTHVDRWRGLAVPGMHRVHLAVHPAGIPGQLRRPIRHRHQRTDLRSFGVQGQSRQHDGLVSSSDSTFGADVDAGPEQLSHSFTLIDVLP
jgi:hypothetical protein